MRSQVLSLTSCVPVILWLSPSVPSCLLESVNQSFIKIPAHKDWAVGSCMTYCMELWIHILPLKKHTVHCPSSLSPHLHPGSPYLGNDGVHLLHAQGDDAGEEGLEHLARLLDHHLQDLEELLHNPAASAALMQDALGQLLSAGEGDGGIAREMILRGLKPALWWVAGRH